LNVYTVTHPSTNLTRRRLTSLIETNALPLRQTTTKYEDVEDAEDMTKTFWLTLFFYTVNCTCLPYSIILV